MARYIPLFTDNTGEYTQQFGTTKAAMFEALEDKDISAILYIANGANCAPVNVLSELAYEYKMANPETHLDHIHELAGELEPSYSDLEHAPITHSAQYIGVRA